MKGRTLLLIILGLVLTFESGFSLTIKIGSSAPDHSPWDIALDELAAEWAKITNNRVRMRIYPGGSTGNEADNLRKVRIGQLQGAVVTTGGLASISSDMLVFSLPLFIRNDGELDYILDVMEPDLKGIIEGKGFSLIAWQPAGWVRPFAKEAVVYPQDLKSFKLALPMSDAAFVQAWKSIGYHIVQITSNEFMTALQTGMIEAFINPALVAASYQWFALASHMCEIDLAPLVGGLLIDTRVWSRIPEEYRPQLLTAAHEILYPLHQTAASLTGEAINLMEKNGLVSHEVDANILAQWVNDLERSYGRIIGKSIDPGLFNKMEEHLEDYRNSHD